jgi:superfamily II DNA/RNA helicase
MMNTFVIPAHGVVNALESPHLSYAQHRLLSEPKPIRLCGAPTGAGKTYAFIEAARQGQPVFFVVPTQTLADDIQATVAQYNDAHTLQQPIHTAIWDGRQSLHALQEDKLPWGERHADFQYVQTHGGMIIVTLEALARLTMGWPQRQHIRLTMIGLLWRFKHLVIDEAHTLNTRAFGLLHLWITIVACMHKRGHITTKLTLLSATHSNLLEDLLSERYLPAEYIVLFDEHISEAPDCRVIHGDVPVHVHDESLVEVLAKHAHALLQEKGKVLLVYDNLIQMRRDTPRLRQILCRDRGIDPAHIIMINGQDRQVEQQRESHDDFDTGTQPQPYHRVIIGTSAVEMGVNFNVDAAMIEPGPDAAALLQRIGRVARGNQSGIVHVSKPQREVPTHFLKLMQCRGTIPVNQLRDMFRPLRSLNIRMAKELGRAYWSMMRRQDKDLMSGMKEAFIELMGEDVSLPGKLLDSLWLAERLPFRKKREFMEWLKAVDRTLQDVRGFAPTVKLRFQDRSFTYSRDWVTKYLRPPDDYDSQENVYIYHDMLENCLRERARPLECVFFHPGGKTRLMSAWTVPSQELWKDYKHMYLNPRGYPFDERTRALYERAAGFIEATRLLPRAEEREGVLVDSEVL